MLNESILIAGHGGQGILFAGKVLAQAALDAGLYTTFFPSYGAEIRGGTANCTVVIADREIGSPVVQKWDNMIILNKPSFDRFNSKSTEDASFVINSSLVKDKNSTYEKRLAYVPLSDISKKELGDTKFTNIISVGVFMKIKNLFPLKHAEEALVKMLKNKSSKMLDLNKKAFSIGVTQI